MKKDNREHNENVPDGDPSVPATEENPNLKESSEPVSAEGSPDPAHELAALNDRFLRLYSEFENYKKRMSRDRVELIKMAGSDIILSLLPILDDFERAIKALEGDGKGLSDGVQLIYTKLRNTLMQKGLQEIKSSGEIFDTDLHEAVTTAPAADEKLKGIVLEELEKGYFLNGKVIRHSKVVVGN